MLTYELKKAPGVSAIIKAKNSRRNLRNMKEMNIPPNFRTEMIIKAHNRSSQQNVLYELQAQQPPLY